MECEILDRVANGDLHTTPIYNSGTVPESDYKANFKRYTELKVILSLMDDQLITGDKNNSGEQPYYTNLRLTESGKEQIRFNSLTLKDIDNAYGKNPVMEWLGKPLLVEIGKYLVIALLVFIGSVYSGEIKVFFTSLFKHEEVDNTSITGQKIHNNTLKRN